MMHEYERKAKCMNQIETLLLLFFLNLLYAGAGSKFFGGWFADGRTDAQGFSLSRTQFKG